MDISIDESGSFSIPAQEAEGWCVAAAYMTPETEKRKYTEILNHLKQRHGKSRADEIKLHEVSEKNYFWFLESLAELKGVLLAVATDSYSNSHGFVAAHQSVHANAIGDNLDRMKYEGGKEGITLLKSQLENLPNQLYIQLICQIYLMLAVVNRGIGYFVQRYPNSLGKFRWRVDQKEPSKKTDFEDAFEKFCPALLQTISLDEPSPALDWCDYRPMKKFIFEPDELPSYLRDEYPFLEGEKGLNIQKIVREDIKFIDSKSAANVQVVDLLASGLRRVLKSKFEDNDKAARLIGRLMVQEEGNAPPVKLLAFEEGQQNHLGNKSSKAVKIMIKSCKRMLKEIK